MNVSNTHDPSINLGSRAAPNNIDINTRPGIYDDLRYAAAFSIGPERGTVMLTAKPRDVTFGIERGEVRLSALCSRLDKMEAMLEELYYAPPHGPGFLKAQQEFIDRQGPPRRHLYEENQ